MKAWEISGAFAVCTKILLCVAKISFRWFETHKEWMRKAVCEWIVNTPYKWQIFRNAVFSACINGILFWGLDVKTFQWEIRSHLSKIIAKGVIFSKMMRYWCSYNILIMRRCWHNSIVNRYSQRRFYDPISREMHVVQQWSVESGPINSCFLQPW